MFLKALERGNTKVNNRYFDVCSRNYTEATESGPMVGGEDISGCFFISV
jgi:hypothetical protein